MNDIRDELADIEAVDPATFRDTGTGAYGLTPGGFVPKPYGRLVAEGLALAREMFGPDVDTGPGSVLRRVVELTSIEHARTYTMLSGLVDDLTVPTARGQALDRLGEELGLPRPFEAATGTVDLSFVGAFPDGIESLTLPAGARLLSGGGHHAALSRSVVLTPSRTTQSVPVAAFHPGPEHNLDGATPETTLATWNALDPGLDAVAALASLRGGASLEDVVAITQPAPLTGGEMRWPDTRYRQLLLRAPRSVWTTRAIEIAVGLVPGVRQVKVIDRYGGLDIDQPIFGNFSFGETVFGTERDLASPYMFTILVAPTAAAVWQGADGLAAAISEAVEDLRPIGLFPDIREAIEVGVGVRADLVIDGVPLSTGTRAVVNASDPAQVLKARLMERVRAYIEGLDFGASISPARITWALMSEPGVADVRNLRLIRYPRDAATIDFFGVADTSGARELECGEALRTGADEIAVYIDDPDDLTII
ncbi:hypothetical protein C882_1761 [Caenispirillum salinarum AK4]|uniref:Uncharacterized protein n=1 Tax=Caenispirillum salinarum AK4 TaxID=1238182 RepID=K9GRA7_9PROT|nr:baseplate J/gp47 family protein [Caenispirillum salinarum]EKV27259.1 hypothetical protein C882_1761 [Caenispirillum salinarum AK4]